jgi:hypothetical protein
MTTQPNAPQVPPAALAGAATNDEDAARTDDGVPVGAADAEADAVRSEAGGNDDTLANSAAAAVPGTAADLDASPDAASTSDRVPVGRADVEADRARSGAEGERPDINPRHRST